MVMVSPAARQQQDTDGRAVGGMIIKGGHSHRDVPLLQFARHFRNACAHGDRWEFKPGQRA